MIMIFTYNESAKEGKVICVPIVTLGVEDWNRIKATISNFPNLVKY